MFGHYTTLCMKELNDNKEYVNKFMWIQTLQRIVKNKCQNVTENYFVARRFLVFLVETWLLP